MNADSLSSYLIPSRRPTSGGFLYRSKPWRSCLVRGTLLLAAIVFALAFAPQTGFSQAVDMALVLVIDTSGSIDPGEYALQLGGYAEAFRDPAAIEAMTSGPHGAIAVDIIVFSDSVTRMMEWTMINDKRSALAVAERIEKAPRVQDGGTYLASAVKSAVMELSDCPFIPSSSTIDISGDGPDNEGVGPIAANNIIDFFLMANGMQTAQVNQKIDSNAYHLRELRDLVRRKGININCVAIQDPQMKPYFEKNLMCGKQSFTLFASSFGVFSTVIRKKIIREIREGIKASVARETQSTKKAPPRQTKAADEGVGRLAKPDKPGGVTTMPKKDTPAESELAPETPIPADLRNSGPAGVSMAAAPAGDLSRRVRIIVKADDSGLPLDDIAIMSSGRELVADKEAAGARPGQIVVDVRLAGGKDAELAVGAPGYESKSVAISRDGPDVHAIRLQRSPMKILW